MTEATRENGLQLISPAFKEHESIPQQHTCKGDNVNPPLNFIGVPGNAKTLTLIMHDPDAVGSDYVHWLVWDIPAATSEIRSNNIPIGAVQGLNSAGENIYTGPCPPPGSGTHRYMFELYALDTALSLDSNTSREKLEEAMKGHIVDQYILTGLAEAEA